MSAKRNYGAINNGRYDSKIFMNESELRDGHMIDCAQGDPT